MKTLAAHTIQNPPEYPPWESTLVRRRSLDVKRLNFCGVYRGGSRIFFSRGCTRLLLYFNTNKPHSFFFPQDTSCIRKPQVISGGWGGVRTPCTFPLDPPLCLPGACILGVLFRYVLECPAHSVILLQMVYGESLDSSSKKS